MCTGRGLTKSDNVKRGDDKFLKTPKGGGIEKFWTSPKEGELKLSDLVNLFQNATQKNFRLFITVLVFGAFWTLLLNKSYFGQKGGGA